MDRQSARRTGQAPDIISGATRWFTGLLGVLGSRFLFHAVAGCAIGGRDLFHYATVGHVQRHSDHDRGNQLRGKTVNIGSFRHRSDDRTPTRMTAVTGQKALWNGRCCRVSRGRRPASILRMLRRRCLRRILHPSSSRFSVGTRRTNLQFADLDETITLTAFVRDAGRQSLSWPVASNAGGTFSGAGPVVQWRAPNSSRRHRRRR